MVDDLILHGVTEPYRMLTARAEYRLRLRANNAATRLTPLAIEAGCVGPERKEWFAGYQARRLQWHEALAKPVSATELADGGLSVRRDAGRRTLGEWVSRHGLDRFVLAAWLPPVADIVDEVAQEVIEDVTYAPYLTRQDAELRDLRASEALTLEPDFPYAEVPGLSNEMIERLARACPVNLAAAGRVSGITPAALSAVLVYARKRVRRAA
jgi:tRNA uridine 5-carboxymethylaminomethyl modification enzyme